MATTIYRDMLNFFRNEFANIILLSLLTAMISIIISYYVLTPSLISEQIQFLSNKNNMDILSDISIKQIFEHISLDQQNILLKVSTAGALAGLVGNTFLTGSLLTMISCISNQRSISVLGAVVLSIRWLPRLLLLTLLTTLIIQLGLIFVVLPGFLTSIAFSLAPVIAITENLGVIKSIRASTEIALNNLRFISPIILSGIFAKTILLLLATKLTTCHPIFIAVLLNVFNNLITSLVLIYLYRLYMFLKKEETIY
ncbi:YciC family protein [Candidatus Palibaumannia cicadellinicola]|uniref:UPF0259 membrane protein YciC n=1 Tax=Baumannia cicadellinicola subsp. Homalodisca coagulata TaxID=374463 RepID=Q1LTG2_BAUCH|nr:YciC family protein [Candidatus Baumannia cicadellinicola]ABF13843.1 conserved hypothetical protein [Baumannia cicadellinicola str. Hc (Homalodisca coagulata)]MBS0032733.1 UPF0259 family protein [Candidatus Baumannia cicadellinicola]MCJ7462265.1 envelope biogenesis factor ElyC [Candidatus Baumannia cicadellinicola]MCJ7462553.1 envelope biogenesis factor ElyC [Candidatus Baumannia cicadellinicola]